MPKKTPKKRKYRRASRKARTIAVSRYGPKYGEIQVKKHTKVLYKIRK